MLSLIPYYVKATERRILWKLSAEILDCQGIVKLLSRLINSLTTPLEALCQAVRQGGVILGRCYILPLSRDDKVRQIYDSPYIFKVQKSAILRQKICDKTRYFDDRLTTKST